jgi:hypothetical protein
MIHIIQSSFNMHRTIFRFVFGCFFFLAGHSRGICQTDQRVQAVQRLQDLASAYKKADHLSFNVTYRYSSEAKPASFLDSLTGSFKMNGNSFWYAIDNAEFLGNDTINVAVFNEDKVIYINGKSVVNQSANPLAMIDSVLLNNEYSSASITPGILVDDLVINFQPGFQFKKVEYFIDVKTGLIRRMIGIIKSQEMYDPQVQPLFDKKLDYGILDIMFTNYQTASFSDQVLNPAKYFVKINRSFQAVGNYASYQILYQASKP